MRACDIDCGWKNDKTSGFCVTFMEVRLFAEQILKFQTLLVRGYMVHRRNVVATSVVWMDRGRLWHSRFHNSIQGPQQHLE